jgi:hypothetical protein
MEGAGSQNHGKASPDDIIDIDQYKRSVGVIWIGMDPDRAEDQVNA